MGLRNLYFKKRGTALSNIFNGLISFYTCGFYTAVVGCKVQSLDDINK